MPLFKSLVSDAITAELVLDNNPSTYLLFPGARVLEGDRPTSTNISGRLVLKLSEDRCITDIVAKLVPHVYARNPHNDRVENMELITASVCRIALGEGILEVGNHELPFSLALDCDAFPVTPLCNINKPGRGVEYKLSYKIDLQLSWSTRNMGPSRIFHKVFASDVSILSQPKTLYSSSTALTPAEERRVYLCIGCSPSRPGNLPDPLHASIDTIVPDHGALQLKMLSRYPSIGSLLTLRLIWVPSNAHCHITGIRCRVEESYNWTSPKTGGPTWRFDSYKIPILDDRNISAKFEPVSLGDSTMLACHYRVRFPDDETISPTTLPFTKTPMEVSHELITELTFYDARTGIRRERRYQRPLTLVACALIAEDVILPTYGDNTIVDHRDFQPIRPTDPFPCACGISDEILIRREGNVWEDWYENTEQTSQTPQLALSKTPAILDLSCLRLVQAMPLFKSRISDAITADLVLDLSPSSYWLYPGARVLGGDRPTSASISGRFVLQLSEKRVLTDIAAKLVPRYYARHPESGDVETGELPSHSVCRIASSNEVLEMGKHELPFSLGLDCDAWPLCPSCEITFSGLHKEYRLWYTIELQLAWSTDDKTANGIFRDAFPKPVQNPGFLRYHHHDQNRYFCVKSSPAPPTSLPDPLHASIDTIVPDYGALQLKMLARFPVVGSLVTIRITYIPSGPDTQITGVRCRIEETLTWKSPKADGQKWTAKPRRIPILDARPINKLFQPVSSDDQTMLSCQFHTRFPDDAQITPTTLAFTKTPMEATHDLITELTFFNAKTTATREMRYKRAVILAPCTLIAEAVMLPAYGDDKVVEREDFQPVRPKDPYPCACGLSNEMLIQREGDVWEGVHKLDDQPIERSQVALDKTPAMNTTV